jgi:hypothetical protein
MRNLAHLVLCVCVCVCVCVPCRTPRQSGVRAYTQSLANGWTVGHCPFCLFGSSCFLSVSRLAAVVALPLFLLLLLFLVIIVFFFSHFPECVYRLLLFSLCHRRLYTLFSLSFLSLSLSLSQAGRAHASAPPDTTGAS